VKVSEQRNVIVLGRLRAIHDAMESARPNDAELSKRFSKCKSLLWAILNEHWDNCNELVTDDDT
jgi:hypothetical protein